MAGKFVYKFFIHMILVPWISCSFSLFATCAMWKSDIFIFLFLNWYYWQPAEVTFLGACQGNVEPWNLCWCWATGLLFHISFLFFLFNIFDWYCKFLFVVVILLYILFDIKSLVSLFWVSFWHKLLGLLYNNMWKNNEWI